MINKLKGLDTLRAIAAIVVLWGHIELLKERNNIDAPAYWGPNGQFGVVLFFVLSGFLITYLIVKEKQKYGDFSFKKFYIRRALRIWPLYYLILFISYFFFTTSEISIRTIVLNILTFSNIPPALKSGWEGSPQVWSIGVEEQFYLFWPLFLYVISEKKMNIFILAFIIIYTVIFPHGLNEINMATIKNEKLYTFILGLFSKTKFNCMAIGGFLGYNLAMNRKWLEIFYKNRGIVVFSFILAFGVWFSNIRFGYFSYEVYSVLFGIMMVGVVKNNFFNIDNKVTIFLGKISYGIYMYHWIVLLFLIDNLPKKLEYYNGFIYVLGGSVTILISWVSYNTYERFFLNLKKKFEV